MHVIRSIACRDISDTSPDYFQSEVLSEVHILHTFAEDFPGYEVGQRLYMELTRGIQPRSQSLITASVSI